MAENGLTTLEAEKELAKVGKNYIYRPKEVTFIDIFFEEVKEPMILLLLVVGFFYSLWGKSEDAVTIFIVIFLLTLSEVLTEYRAKKAISLLEKIAAPKSRVKRDGKINEIDSSLIVPGDLLILSTGTKVSADCVLVEASSLMVDESALTGESFPVEKEIKSELSAGTIVTSGEGEALVVVTGNNTKLGRVAVMASQVKPPKTRLQLTMKSLAGKLVYVSIFFSVLIPLIGIIRGQDPKIMILTGLSLAFAIIPEELPIVITMVLGLGSYTLSKKNFWVKKIKAAETLGNTTVIVTDKTGTITDVRLKVISVFPNNEKEIIKGALACLPDHVVHPFDTVIEDKAKELNIVNSYGKSKKQRDFGDERKTRSILRKVSNHYELFTIGAPEEIFKLCNDETKNAKIYLKMQAELGRRVVGIAHKKLGTKLNGTPLEKLEKKMSLVGLISFEDPPREGVKETVEQAKRAGVRTIMVTGDHPLTALNIAKQVGITDNDMVMTGQELDKLTDQLLEKSIHKFNVFARTTPEHKYRIVKALQANKEVVAVTGDGINDTLALKGADIGIAMGLRGTDVAKEAAEVVLADDNYITIAQAIFEGRKFFDNLQKGIKYYLSVKLSLIMIFLLPVIIGIATPMSPIQIIVLELFMDLAASAGFVFEPKEKDIYTRPPLRPDQNVLDKPAIYDIVLKGFLLFTGVVGIYLIATNLHLGVSVARTYAFSAWIFGQLLLALFSRSDKETVVALGFFDNMVINIWGSCALLFLFLAINIPTIGMRFNLTKVSGFDLLTIFLTMLLLMDVIELKKIFFPIKTAPLGSG